MPELPDVETLRRYVDSTSLHQEVTSVQVRDRRILEDLSPQVLGRRLKGFQFEATGRHGKYLVIQFGEKRWLWLHFGMTGDLSYFRGGPSETEHGKVMINFANGYLLAYINIRRLGKVGICDDRDRFAEDRGLGPDALEIQPGQFINRLEGRRGMIKPALMDQGLVAGVGNIYADEILFQSGIHPRETAKTLASPRLKELYRVMKRVLREAVDRRADPKRMPGSWLLPRRNSEGRCPRSHGPLKKIKVAGRPTYFCFRCQRPARN